MGALTNNRKRGDDYFKSIGSPSPPIDQSCSHISKRCKLSISPILNTPNSSRRSLPSSVVTRVLQYPDRKSGFSRPVHAPVRNTRFGHFSSVKKSEISDSSSKESSNMGRFSTFNRIRMKFENARAVAFGSLRHVITVKEKEVIQIDSDDENREEVANDSSIEEVEVVDVVGSKRKRRGGDVENEKEFYVKRVEEEARSLNSSVVTNASNAIAKVDDGDKTVFTQSDQGGDDSGVPYYKRMYELIKRSDGKQASLKFNIEIIEKSLQWFNILRPQKKDEQLKDVAKECFVPLTEEEESEVSHALANYNRRKVLVTHESSNIDISGEKLQCLRPGAWLNDEVINLYLELLKEREKREPKKFLKCHFFNTFFYKKLISGKGGYNFQSVRRWTTQRKLGYSLLDCDKIFVPIHQEIHWCLAIINKKDEKFQYLDSLRGIDSKVLHVLARYFVDEVKDKCGKDINVSSWNQEFVTNLPEQENGYDCGVFMIKYADFYSRDIGLRFSQEHMPYFRRRTAKEILKLRAE